jgi:hypothetical protein
MTDLWIQRLGTAALISLALALLSAGIILYR